MSVENTNRGFQISPETAREMGKRATIQGRLETATKTGFDWWSDAIARQDGLLDSLPPEAIDAAKNAAVESKKHGFGAYADAPDEARFESRHELIKRVRLEQPYTEILAIPSICHLVTVGAAGLIVEVPVPSGAILLSVSSTDSAFVSFDANPFAPIAGEISEGSGILVDRYRQIFYIAGISSVKVGSATVANATVSLAWYKEIL